MKKGMESYVYWFFRHLCWRENVDINQAKLWDDILWHCDTSQSVKIATQKLVFLWNLKSGI